MKQLIILTMAIILNSCTSMSYKKTLEKMKHMPTPNYSYIIQPNFNLNKVAAEEKLKELYNAEELKIVASGIHTYDKNTKAQIKEKYWLKSVILNSDKVANINNEEISKVLAKEIAETVLAEIENLENYDKIEIMLMQQWNDGQVKSIKRNFFFTVPNLEETNW